jgi:hypothetical protein
MMMITMMMMIMMMVGRSIIVMAESPHALSGSETQQCV